MGIKNLNTLLREICKYIFKKISLKDLKNTRVAIDISIIIMKYWSPSLNKTLSSFNIVDENIEGNSKFHDILLSELIGFITNFIIKLLSNGIVPVVVFDGKPPQKKEDHARKERREKREKALLELNLLKEKIANTDPLLRDDGMSKRLSKLYIQTYYPSRDDHKIIKDIFIDMKIPVLQAVGEAEELCSYLCRNGKVDTVYSTDTDNYVHGCPYLLIELDKNYQKGQSFTIVALTDILNGLELSFMEFVNLCILMGCDYNSSIKRVGWKTSYKLIKEFKYIQNLPAKYDTSVLNYNDCVQLFNSYNKSIEMVCDESSLKYIDKLSVNIFGTGSIDKSDGFNNDKYNLSQTFKTLNSLYKSFNTDIKFEHNKLINLGLFKIGFPMDILSNSIKSTLPLIKLIHPSQQTNDLINMISKIQITSQNIEDIINSTYNCNILLSYLQKTQQQPLYNDIIIIYQNIMQLIQTLYNEYDININNDQFQYQYQLQQFPHYLNILPINHTLFLEQVHMFITLDDNKIEYNKHLQQIPINFGIHPNYNITFNQYIEGLKMQYEYIKLDNMIGTLKKLYNIQRKTNVIISSNTINISLENLSLDNLTP